MLNIDEFFFFGALLQDIINHVLVLYFLLGQLYFSEMIYVQNFIIKSNNLILQFVCGVSILKCELFHFIFLQRKHVFHFVMLYLGGLSSSHLSVCKLLKS